MSEPEPAPDDRPDPSPPEVRLSELAERAASILRRWDVAGERHERAVTQLESQLTELEVASARLQRDASQKMHELERVVQHEWTALRDVHEEPIRQLREQANSLTEVCIATAHSAQRGFDQAEARLAAIEADLQQRITELRHEVHAVVQELRANPGLARLGAAPPTWPLDGVTRLHQQLRQNTGEPPAGTSVVDVAPAEAPAAPPPSVPVVTPSAAPPRRVPVEPVSAPPAAEKGGPSWSDRVRSLEQALDERDQESREIAERARRFARFSRVAVVALVAVLVLAGGFAWWLQRQVRSRVDEAQRQSQQATETAAQQMAATREQAAREIAAARDLATQAQMVSAALAAPDLIRYVLGSAVENMGGSAQALWSRTRGFVFSGSRLSPLPEGRTYQVWLLTRGDPVSAGTVTPDESGTATLAIPPPAVGPVIGVVVTDEPAGGSPRPTGRVLLARYQVQS